MSAHTPGPWHCKNADGKWASAMDWRVDHDDFRGGSWLPVRAGKKVLALAFCGDGPNSVRAEAELDANTRLIARAPDLLAENTRLTARVAKLEAALRDLRFLFKQPGENNTDAFERIALRFYEECHMLAPGKSQPLAFNGTPTDEARREAYDAWINAFHNRADAALTPEPR